MDTTHILSIKKHPHFHKGVDCTLGGIQWQNHCSLKASLENHKNNHFAWLQKESELPFWSSLTVNHFFGLLYLGPGSNRHDIAITGFWIQRVYQFRHQGMLISKTDRHVFGLANINFLEKKGHFFYGFDSFWLMCITNQILCSNYSPKSNKSLILHTFKKLIKFLKNKLLWKQGYSHQKFSLWLKVKN